MSFGKYELLDSMGKGSIAEVFKAKSFGAQGFEKLLVIKRVSAALSQNESFKEAFVEDAKNALLLNHGNIVQVFDLGEIDGEYFLAMELVKGVSLATLLATCHQSEQPLPAELAVYIAAEIAKGLDFAHRKRGRDLTPLNIIHGDINPFNILVSNEGEVKIADFGIARAKAAAADFFPDDIKQRLPYRSPEQSNGQAAEKRSDIFSLGILLLEMVCHEHPLAGINGASLESIIEHRRHLEMLGKVEGIGKDLIEIADYMVKINPLERYEDAGTVYEGLIAYIYNMGARTGAHSLATFIETLPTDIDIPIFEESPIQSDPLTEAFKFSVVPESAEKEPVSESTPPPVEDPDAELRDVSVLAVDFHGAPPKDALLDQLREIVENNGGSVVETENDSMVAVFGLDLAYGRELEEAMDAAFKLRRAISVLNPSKESRIGLCVWPARVSVSRITGVIENNLYLEALSKAKEAAGFAEDSVLTSRRGRKHSGSIYQFEIFPVDLPEGSAEMLYRAIGRLPAPESFGRLFGRQEDLRALGKIFSSVSVGKGGILSLQGPEGIGKTRLLREGQWRLMSSGGDVGWFEAVCIPWNQLTPYAAVAAIFRSMLALEEQEVGADPEEKVGRFRELGLGTEEVEAISALMGISENNNQNGEQSRLFYSALMHAVTSLASDRMVVLVWENAEHLDLESKWVLEKMGEAIEELPVLIVLTSRETLAGMPCSHDLALKALAAKDVERLFLSRIGAANAPEALLDHVNASTRGNPLHVEELTIKLLEQPNITITDGEVRVDPKDIEALEPETLEQITEYRVKCFSSEKLRILRTAAVLGYSFNTQLLGAVLRQAAPTFKQTLLALNDENVLTRVLANEFAFSTGFIRDVIYEGTPSKERGRLHRAIVNAIDSVFEGKTERFTGRVGIHFQETGNLEKAIARFIDAGKLAAAQHADRVALALYIRALGLLQELPDRDPNRMISVCLPIGDLALRSNQYTLGLDKIQVAEWISDDVTDKATLAKSLVRIAELNARLEHNVEVDWYVEWAVDLTREIEDKELGYEVKTSAGQVYYLLGDVKRAVPFYREAIELIRDTTDKDRLVSCIAQLSIVEAGAGELEQAMETLAEADALIDDTLNPATRCKVEHSRGSAYASAGNLNRAIQAQLRSLEIAKEYGLKKHVAETSHNAGKLYLDLGDHARAFTHLTTSREAAEELGLGGIVKLNRLLLDYIDAVEMGNDEGVQALEKLLLDALEREAAWEQLHLLFYLSKIYVERGQNAMAREHLTQLLDLGARLHNHLYHAKAEHMLKEIHTLDSIRV